MNKIMIVSLLFNRQPLTKLWFENLMNITEEPFDLYLWDNGSQKPTQELLDKIELLHFKNGSTITIIRNDRNFGIGTSLYELQNFRKPGQHFMKIDNDVDVPKDPMWLTTLRELIENNEQGYKILGYPPHEKKHFLNNMPMETITLSKPLTQTGNIRFEVYKSPGVLGCCFLGHSDFYDKFKYKSYEKKYGIGCDCDIFPYVTENKINVGYIFPESMIGFFERWANLEKACPETKEFYDWKVSMVPQVDPTKWVDFIPTQVGNDTSELKIRKDILL